MCVSFPSEVCLCVALCGGEGGMVGTFLCWAPVLRVFQVFCLGVGYSVIQVMFCSNEFSCSCQTLLPEVARTAGLVVWQGQKHERVGCC